MADKRGDANYIIIDFADYKLALLGENGGYASGAATWSEAVAAQDGFENHPLLTSNLKELAKCSCFASSFSFFI